MTKLVLIIIVLFGVGFVFKLLNKTEDSIEKEKQKKLYQYKKKDFLITRAEHEFFDILVSLFGGQYHVFTQVHLPTILEHKVNGQHWKSAFSHINGKSVDFVICDKSYIKPLLAIELDDSSHLRADRIERDSEVERIMKEAGMSLIRFPNKGSFDKEEIRRQITERL